MEESLYDKLAYIASINLFTKKKENEDICFDMSHISFNDKSFWFLEQFTANMRPILKIKKIYVSANFFRFLKYCITKQHHILHFSFKKNVKLLMHMIF